MTQTSQDPNTPSQHFGVTLHGLPVTIVLEWPYKRSATGADFYILHADCRLEDGRGLHALVALQLTLTVKAVVPSLEPKDVGAPSINNIRKAVDTHELEFIKSPKRVPVQFNSRTWDFKRSKWAFGQASDEQIAGFLKRKVYWQSKIQGSGAKAWIADPTDIQYLDAAAEQVSKSAQRLADAGMIKLDGEYATATAALTSEANHIEGEMRHALEELEKKHAFERG